MNSATGSVSMTLLMRSRSSAHVLPFVLILIS